VLEVDRVIAEYWSDQYAKRTLRIRTNVDCVVTETDAQERTTRASTATTHVAARCSDAAVTVSRSTAVVAVTRQTNLKLARTCDLSIHNHTSTHGTFHRISYADISTKFCGC